MQASLQATSQRTQKGGEPGVLLSCQPGRQGPATRDASAGQPAAPRTTGPCAGQGISACRASPAAGAQGGAQGSAAARRTRAMTPLPADQARPMGCQTRPGSSRQQPGTARARPAARSRRRGALPRRAIAAADGEAWQRAFGRRLTIRRHQHSHPAHRDRRPERAAIRTSATQVPTTLCDRRRVGVPTHEQPYVPDPLVAGRRVAFAARAPALRPLRLGCWWAGGLELGARRAGLRLPERCPGRGRGGVTGERRGQVRVC